MLEFRFTVREGKRDEESVNQSKEICVKFNTAFKESDEDKVSVIVKKKKNLILIISRIRKLPEENTPPIKSSNSEK